MFRKVGLLVVSGLVLSGCSLTSNNVALAKHPSLESRLLALRDLPSGWSMYPMPQVGSDLCAAPALSSSIVGPSGVAVAFQRTGGEPLLVEYLQRTSQPAVAMERAVSQFVASQFSCSEASYGRVTRKSVNMGIIEYLTIGNWSVATKDRIFRNGKRSELGYILVRVKGYFFVVAYENVGSLDMGRLKNLTDLALSKVNS